MMRIRDAMTSYVPGKQELDSQRGDGGLREKQTCRMWFNNAGGL